MNRIALVRDGHEVVGLVNIKNDVDIEHLKATGFDVEEIVPESVQQFLAGFAEVDE